MLQWIFFSSVDNYKLKFYARNSAFRLTKCSVRWIFEQMLRIALDVHESYLEICDFFFDSKFYALGWKKIAITLRKQRQNVIAFCPIMSSNRDSRAAATLMLLVIPVTVNAGHRVIEGPRMSRKVTGRADICAI